MTIFSIINVQLGEDGNGRCRNAESKKEKKKEIRKKKKRKKKEKKSMQETSHFAAGPQYTLECKWSERKLKINERAKKVVRERQTCWIFKINH